MPIDGEVVSSAIQSVYDMVITQKNFIEYINCAVVEHMDTDEAKKQLETLRQELSTQELENLFSSILRDLGETV